MAGRIRLLLALGVAVLAVALGGCGGGGEETTSAPPATGTAAADEGQRSAQAEGGGGAGGSGDGASGAKGGGDPARKGGDGAKPKPDDGPSQPRKGGSGSDPTVRGSFSARSRQFRIPGGDNSIQTYGAEAGDAEREAADASVRAYLDARARGNWAATCRHLASEAIKSLEQLVKSAPQLKDKDCAEIIGLLNSGASPKLRRNPMAGGIVSFRVDGDRAFALFKGEDGKGYFIPMARDGGEWKVASLAPVPF